MRQDWIQNGFFVPIDVVGNVAQFKGCCKVLRHPFATVFPDFLEKLVFFILNIFRNPLEKLLCDYIGNV
jgi:hypothetical protein